MRFTKDDRVGAVVTLVINGLFLIFSLWYTIDFSKDFRPSFIEVELGEYQTGQDAEFSEEKNDEVAKRPDPSEIEPDEPVEDAPKPEETPQETVEEETKPVDLADQTQEIEEEPIKTPDTEIVDPNAKVSDVKEVDVEIPPVAKKDADTSEGEKESGDTKGDEGDLESDEGTGNDEDKSAPFELKWEGDLERDPRVQPLPVNNANVEAVITVRFEVRPNGTVGRIIPKRKMSPELEREVMKTLRSWRFSRLPSGAPQQNQWGEITFRFVFS